jgi:hypothetical protein
LVGVAVKEMLVPLQILVPGLAAILTDGVTIGMEKIEIEAEVEPGQAPPETILRK